MDALTGILPKQRILDMAFQFQDDLGIYDGASWQYLIANAFGISGDRPAYSMESTYFGMPQSTICARQSRAVCHSVNPTVDSQTLPRHGIFVSHFPP